MHLSKLVDSALIVGQFHCDFSPQEIFNKYLTLVNNIYVKTLYTSEDGAIFSGSLYCTEKAMTPHSSTLAWKIPWPEEPGRLQSLGS